MKLPFNINLYRLFELAIFASFFACSTIPSSDRTPQALRATYDHHKVELLSKAAENKILFQISDSVFKDTTSRQVGEKCKSTGDTAWVSEAYEVLDLFANNPKLFSKIHVIELKRGDTSGLEINRDLDGATYLVLSYAKVESRRELKNLTEVPCESQTMDLIGKELSEIQYEWPSREKISTFLLAQEERTKVARFDYDPKFLEFLAQRQTIFRMTPELAFEKSVDGSPLLSEIFKDLSEKSKQVPSKAFDFLMQEISVKSKQGQNLKIFSLKKDSELGYGVSVQSQGSIQRKIQGTTEPTFPYISYKLDSGKFVFASFDKLESCLENMPTGSGTLDRDPESFLSPGYHCH